MKAKIFSVLQRIGRSFMLPIAVLPVAGLFLGIGSSLTSNTTISSLHLEAILGKGTFLNNFLTILTKVGNAFFNNLPIIFAAAVALGMAKKAKEVAVISAVIAFFVMHTTINGMLTLSGVIMENQVVGTNVLDGTITSTCGILSLEMGVFGGIIVGLGVSFLHNRFYQIQLPSVLSFFEGERFIPIISTISFLFVGILMFYLWPFIQNAIFALGKVVSTSGYFGTFIYGVIKRLLVPFGLHHVFYLPFWQTAIGGTMTVNDVMVYGGQNIFFAQLADPGVLHFSSEATKYFTGEFIFMIFGLPGAALAMYHTAKPEMKKAIGTLFFSAALTSILTGITEPIEFSFLFAAPLLFGVQVLLAGSAYMIAHIFNIAIGLTFSGGLIDFVIFGVLQGNSKTNWILVIPIGIIYFFLYYFSFRYLIKKFDLKTPGRETNNKLLILKKPNLCDNKNIIDKQSQLIIRGLGGRDNFNDLDCCITRLRVTVNDNTKLNEGLLKQSGAAAIITQGNSVQIIYGPKASSIKTKLNEYLSNVPVEYDEYKEEIVYNQSCIELGNIVDGEVMPIESSCDQIFSHKLMGDGVIIKPHNGLIVSPCDGVITMIYPTKHAVGIKLDNGCELLLHFGIDTVNLNGNGFEVLVKINQRINKGDLILNADLEYIREKATSDQVILVITKIVDNLKIEKNYGEMKRGTVILKILS
ncbi:PTS transporter subunit IIABC [Thomasclavelia cocleata]|jgi:glucose-specific phosphotransferase system IIA component|uniref:PTS transporter subunit IIABC n=2 Tax=Thomasclavelia cocleata TaxID=69824 RepID=UPI00242ABE9C|nr:glucose PTS transporter subunit IIA [Thomasclavelia cocleata]MCI9630805.1 PTS transporter subunit EIIC [Thomasclavelia cocleata]